MIVGYNNISKDEINILSKKVEVLSKELEDEKNKTKTLKNQLESAQLLGKESAKLSKDVSIYYSFDVIPRDFSVVSFGCQLYVYFTVNHWRVVKPDIFCGH